MSVGGLRPLPTKPILFMAKRSAYLPSIAHTLMVESPKVPGVRHLKIQDSCCRLKPSAVEPYPILEVDSCEFYNI